MNSNWRDPFGSNWLGQWLADRSDRRQGQTGRLAARRGYLKPMGDQGKVIWLLAGRQRSEIRLAVELLRAIREKRLDVRLVLTFEHDYPDLLAALDDCDKTGWGYAPCDRSNALKRAFQRLSPYGFIVLNPSLRPNLQQMLVNQPRILHLGQPHIDSGADLQTLLTQAQVDPNFRSLVNQGRQRHLWWIHDAHFHARQWHHWLARHPEDVLFVSGGQPEGRHQPISQWNRSPLPDGELVWLDDDKWLPAISASVTASHFNHYAPIELWQAMAGGAATSIAPFTLPPPLAGFSSQFTDPYPTWEEWRLNPIRARQAGDQARRLFWQERRNAEAGLQAILDRVFAW